MDHTITALLVALTALSWLLQLTVAPGSSEFSHVIETLPLFLSALTGARIAEALLMSLFKSKVRLEGPTDLLRTMTSLVLYSAALLLWMRYGLGFDVSGLLATSAVFTVVIGFALQTTLGNLFSGLSLELERPLRIGDYVRMGDMEGHIEALRWRSISIKTPNNTWIVLPNGVLTSHSIEVLRRDIASRMLVTFHIPPSVPPVGVLTVAKEVMTSGLPQIALDPAPIALFLGTSPQTESRVFAVRFYSLSRDRASLSSLVLTRLWYALSRHGIEMRADSELRLPGPDEADKSSPSRQVSGRSRGSAAFESVFSSIGKHLKFGPGESVAPELAGFVVDGVMREELMADEVAVAESVDSLLEQTPPADAQLLIPAEILALMSARAARFLGPVAHAIADRSARLTDDPYLVYFALAKRIVSADDRVAFLESAPAHPTRRLELGAPFGWAGILGLEPIRRRRRVVNEAAELLILDRPDLVELLKTMNAASLVAFIASEPGLQSFNYNVLAEKLRHAAH